MDTTNLIEKKGELKITGPMTSNTVTQLYGDLLVSIGKVEKEDSENKACTVNLSTVTSVDSTAIALLVAIHRIHDQVIWANVSDDIMSLIQLYGIDWLKIKP
jgi:ABC-type transporter Mla MlaB component